MKKNKEKKLDEFKKTNNKIQNPGFGLKMRIQDPVIGWLLF